jgi:hypothetical protein
MTLYAKWNVTDSNQWAVAWNLNGGAWPGRRVWHGTENVRQ